MCCAYFNVCVIHVLKTEQPLLFSAVVLVWLLLGIVRVQ